MVSPVLTERRHSGGFLVSEEEAGRSRDQVTLLQQLPPAAPAAPTLTSTAGGTITGATYYAKVTYVGAFGQTEPSGETSGAVSTNNLLVVDSPSAATDATGYNVYVATATGAETLQNSSPIAIGTNWTQPTTGLVTGSTPPTINPNPILPAGLVLGETLVGSSGTYAANGGNTGNFTCGTVTIGEGVVEGTYGIEFIAATVFNVSLPGGALLGEGHTGTAFSVGGLGFTLTAGGTAAVAGDGATIAIAANTNVGLYGPLNLNAADGTQNAAAILFNETDASQGNTKVTVIDRAAQVNGSELIYPASATTTQIAAINAQFSSLGVIVR